MDYRPRDIQHPLTHHDQSAQYPPSQAHAYTASISLTVKLLHSLLLATVSAFLLFRLLTPRGRAAPSTTASKAVSPETRQRTNRRLSLLCSCLLVSQSLLLGYSGLPVSGWPLWCYRAGLWGSIGGCGVQLVTEGILSWRESRLRDGKGGTGARHVGTGEGDEVEEKEGAKHEIGEKDASVNV